MAKTTGMGIAAIPRYSVKQRNRAATGVLAGILAAFLCPVGASSGLGLHNIQQSNPFASCPEKPQTNTLTSNLLMLGGVDLAGSDSSAITISGLTGAVVQGESIPIFMSGACPQNGIAGPNKCIWMSAEPKSWRDAEQACVASGGHLTSFNNQQEEIVAMRLMRDNPLGPHLWGVPTLIGFSKDPQRPAWTWSDGSSPKYTNWQPGDPHINPVGKTCAATFNGRWITANCSQPFPSLCSKNLDAPATLFCSGSTPGLGKWDDDSLKLSLCTDAVIKADSAPITFKFNVTNPPHAQASPGVNISVSGTFSIPPTPMQKPGQGGNAAGIPGAADPMLIVDRCSSCPAGSFLDGIQGCKPCLPGSWSDQADAPNCRPCPPGSTSSAASTSVDACVCSHGHMSDDGSRCEFCESQTVLTGPAGTVTDGSGSDDYLAGTVCVWTIVSNTTRKVALSFDYFDVIENFDLVIVSACDDAACSKMQPLATLTGALLPGPGRRFSIPFPPRPPPPGPAPAPPRPGPPRPGQKLEAASGILQIRLRSAPMPQQRGSRGGFRARWYTPEASLQSASIFRIDTARPCPAVTLRGQQPRTKSRGGQQLSEKVGDAVRKQDGKRRRRASLRMSDLDATSSAVLALNLAVESSKAAAEAPLAITLRGVGGAGALDSARPGIRVELADNADACLGQKCFRVLGFGKDGPGTQSTPVPWAEAEQKCQREFGGHLASIETQEENDFVYWLMTSANPPTQYAWIGYHMDAHAKEYVWTDSSSSSFDNWLPLDTKSLPQTMYPQSGNCSSMWSSPVLDSRWRRTPCSIQLSNMICSRHMPVGMDGLFCSGSERDVGEWDPDAAGGTLTLRLCPGQALISGLAYLISANLSYSTLPAVIPPMNISFSGGLNISATQMDKLVDVSGCYACPSMGYRRFGGGCSSPCAQTLTDPNVVSVYCKSCPTGSQTQLSPPSAQPDIQSCSCTPGFLLDNDHHEQASFAECRICPTSSYCPGHGVVDECPGNQSAQFPGAYDPAQCGCGAGYALVASVCVPCPAGSYCPGGSGAATRQCPYQTTSLPGSVMIQDCVYCKPFNVESSFAGTIATNIQQSSIQQSCAWILRPPGVSRVVVTVTTMQLRAQSLDPSGDMSGGMYLDLKECTDKNCQQSTLLKRFNQSLPNLELASLRLNSSTGVMLLVFGHIATHMPQPAYGPAQPYPTLAIGSGLFSADWFSEPSLATYTISQSNPFASCPNNSSMLQSNVLMLHINFRSSLPLSGAQHSSLTISGLRGAVKPSSGIPVEVTSVRDACIDDGGARVEGSDKCFKPFLDTEPLDPTAAQQQCLAWGGELACIENDAEEDLLTEVMRSQAASRGSQFAWIGYRSTNIGGTCDSAYTKWREGSAPTGNPNVDYCTSLSPLGWWQPYGCSGRFGWICSKAMAQEHRVETNLFCLGSRAGWGDFDAGEADGTLRLKVCPDKALEGYTTYVIAFTVWNPSVDQESPPISLTVAGSFALPRVALGKPGGGSGDTRLPLKIVGGSPDSVCHFPDNSDDHGPGRAHARGWGASSILGVVFLALLLLAAFLSQWTPCREFVLSAADKVGIQLPEWGWPRWQEVQATLEERSWLRLPRFRLPLPTSSSFYRRFTGSKDAEQEFETIDRAVI